MATIEQSGKKNLALIHVLWVSETLNCVHRYSKLKLTADKAFVQYLKTLFLLKAKSARKKNHLKTSFFFPWKLRENVIVTAQYLNNRERSPGLSHLGERPLKWQGERSYLRPWMWWALTIPFQFFKMKSNIYKNGSFFHLVNLQ